MMFPVPGRMTDARGRMHVPLPTDDSNDGLYDTSEELMGFRSPKSPGTLNTNVLMKIALRFLSIQPAVIFPVLVFCIPQLIQGYDIGVAGTASTLIARSFGLSLTSTDLLVASFPFASVFGSLLAAHVTDVLGRRLCLILSSLLIHLGLLLQLLSPLSLPLFLAGRLTCGAAIGACMLLTPVFISEIVPPEVRGALAGALPHLFLSAGLFLGYLTSFLFTATSLASSHSWRFLIGLSWLPAIVLTLAALSVTDSPRWLLQVGRVREAAELLLHLHGGREEEAANALDQMTAAMASAAAAAAASGGGSGGGGGGGNVSASSSSSQLSPTASSGLAPYSHFSSGVSPPPSAMAGAARGREGGVAPPSHTSWEGVRGGSIRGSMRERGGILGGVLGGRGVRLWREVLQPSEGMLVTVVTAVATAFYEQASGVEALLYFLPHLFALLGFPSLQGALIAAMATATVAMLSSLLPLACLDELGRRPLMIISSAGLVVVLFLQAMATWLTLSSSARGDLSPLSLSASANAAVICAILAATVAAFFSLGLGPISSLLPGELFPVRLQTRGAGLTVAVNRLTAAVVVGSFLPVLRTAGPAVASMVFGATLLFGVIFFYFFLPETKGVSLFQLSAVQAVDSQSQSAVWTHASSKADVPLHGHAGNLRARHMDG